MDDYKDAIAACCKQLRLSVNLVENAMIQTGGNHQEYLYHLLRDEIQYRKSTRVAKLINTAGFPLQHSFTSFDPGEVQFPAGVTVESLKALDFYRAGNNLVMYGSTGTGKTMLSICIGMEACKKGLPEVYTLALQKYRVFLLMNHLHITKQGWEKILHSKAYNALRGKHDFA